MTGQTALPSKWVDALLLRFNAIWPRKWADSINGVDYRLVSAEWANGLAGLSGADLKRGIEHCRAHLAWPPSISEFRAACQDHATPEQRAYAARAAEAQPLLASQTRAETLQAGAEAAAKVKAGASTTAAQRTLRDALAGLWTPEREEAFQHDCQMVGAKYPTPGWLHEAWNQRTAA